MLPSETVTQMLFILLLVVNSLCAEQRPSINAENATLVFSSQGTEEKYDEYIPRKFLRHGRSRRRQTRFFLDAGRLGSRPKISTQQKDKKRSNSFTKNNKDDGTVSKNIEKQKKDGKQSDPSIHQSHIDDKERVTVRLRPKNSTPQKQETHQSNSFSQKSIIEDKQDAAASKNIGRRKKNEKHSDPSMYQSHIHYEEIVTLSTENESTLRSNLSTSADCRDDSDGPFHCCVGLSGLDCINHIESIAKDLIGNCYILKPNEMTIMDWRLDRVWVRVNNSGVVENQPHRG